MQINHVIKSFKILFLIPCEIFPSECTDPNFIGIFFGHSGIIIIFYLSSIDGKAVTHILLDQRISNSHNSVLARQQSWRICQRISNSHNSVLARQQSWRICQRISNSHNSVLARQQSWRICQRTTNSHNSVLARQQSWHICQRASNSHNSVLAGSSPGASASALATVTTVY